MDDKNYLTKYTYNQFAKRDIPYKYTFDDWRHIDNLVEKLPSNAKILDVGCGNGLPIDKYLSEKGFEVLGIDISENQIELAKNNAPQAKFEVMDMEELSLPNENFDAALLLYSLFHLPRGIHQKILTDINKTVKPGGILLVTMGVYETETTRDEFEDLKLFWSSWDKLKNKAILAQSGFNLLYEDMHKIGSEDHMIVMARKS